MYFWGELIVTVFESFASETVLSAKTNIIQKWRYKKFIQKLEQAINEFCKAHECIYLDSSSFEYFIRNTHFVEKVVGRCISTKIDQSKKDFLRDQVKEARNIAERENVYFSHDEENLIKDLYKLIEENTTLFYDSLLSDSQKRIVALFLRGNEETNELVVEGNKVNRENFECLQKRLIETTTISAYKAEPIARLISRKIWTGELQDIEEMMPLIYGKSDDLECYVALLRSYFQNATPKVSLQNLQDIKDNQIRDIAVRTMLPILAYSKEDITGIEKFTTSKTLKEITKAVADRDYSKIVEEKIEYDNGTELHNLTLNKTMLCEEEWLVKQIAVLFLYKKNIWNIERLIEEIIKGNETWLNNLLIKDKEIDVLGKSNLKNDKLVQEILDKLSADEPLFLSMNRSVRSLYYTIKLKGAFWLNQIEKEEHLVPAELRDCDPICDFLMMIRIKKGLVSEEELYDYCVKKESYWLINNYYVENRDLNSLIGFCQKHEDLFSKSSTLFFMFLGALRTTNNTEERRKYLEKYATLYSGLYEFWNEYLEIDKSDEIRDEFVEKCKNGNLNSIFANSEWLIVERLLQIHKYEEAIPYIHRLELLGTNDYRIEKYKAVIEQHRGNDVDALKLLKAAFEKCDTDPYVVDTIITISLMNNRFIDTKYIDSAIRIGTSRMHMLVSTIYGNQGKIIDAKNEAMKSILLSNGDFTPAYGLFFSLETTAKDSNTVRTIKVTDADTAIYITSSTGKKFCICIYENQILPESPFICNGDIHIYVETAAKMGLLRKRKNDLIQIKNEECCISEIAPLDFYYTRLCMSKMTEAGAAKQVTLSRKNGHIDTDALKEQIVDIVGEEKSIDEWLKQYDNFQDVPLPLFAYKRFTRASYLQFIDIVFSDKNYFIREIKAQSTHSNKFMLSFATLLLLYKIGFPASKIIENGGAIPASTWIQICTDITSIINEYDKNTVASMGIIDDKLFMHEVGEYGKEYWLKEAGEIKAYCKEIPRIENEHDLRGEFFEKVDIKEALGICDYDAIAIVQNQSEYSLLSMEALLISLAMNETVKLPFITLQDWLVESGIKAVELLGYKVREHRPARPVPKRS